MFKTAPIVSSFSPAEGAGAPQSRRVTGYFCIREGHKNRIFLYKDKCRAWIFCWMFVSSSGMMQTSHKLQTFGRDDSRPAYLLRSDIGVVTEFSVIMWLFPSSFWLSWCLVSKNWFSVVSPQFRYSVCWKWSFLWGLDYDFCWFCPLQNFVQ